MKDLFLEIPKIEKIAWVSLNQDSTTWIKDIITQFLADFPMLQNLPLSITWKKKDANKGYAVGMLNVMNGAVPIIIKDYNLSPLDVIMFGNMSIPLTVDVINELNSSTSPFKGFSEEKSKDALNIFGDIYLSPVNGMSSVNGSNVMVRDAVKVAEYKSIIDKINTISKKDVENIFSKLAEDLPTQRNFVINKNTDILRKLASKEEISASTITDTYLRNLTIDRQYIYEDKDGNSILKQASSQLDYTWSTELTVEESTGLDNIYKSEDLVKHANINDNKDISKIPEVNDYGYFNDGNYISPEIKIISIHDHKSLEKFAFFKYKDQNGGIILDKDKNYTIIDKFNFDKVASNLSIDSENDIKLHDYGFFELNGEAITTPFEVIGLQKVAGVGNFEIKANHILYNKNYYPINTDGTELIAHDFDKNAAYVPGNARFIKLSKRLKKDDIQNDFYNLIKSANVNKIQINTLCGFKEVNFILSNEEENQVVDNIVFLSKNAEFKVKSTYNINVDIKKSNIINRDSDGYFWCDGPAFTKMANQNDDFKINTLDKNEVIWNSIQLGASEKDIIKIGSLRRGDSYIITNNLEVPKKIENIVKIAEKFINDNFSYIKIEDLPILVKEASVFSDKTTVDAVLSLGLMNKYNIMEFVELIPDYERVAGELSKLLLMSRLGLSTLPEKVIKVTMESLMTIIFMLKKINISSK